MATKFQESVSQADWGVLTSKSPMGGILCFRERGHLSSATLLGHWLGAAHQKYGLRQTGWVIPRGCFWGCQSIPAPSRRSDSCIFTITIMSVLLQHFILAQIKRLTTSLTLIYLKHRWYQRLVRVINFFHKLLLSTYYISGTMPAAIDGKVIKTRYQLQRTYK